MENFSRVDIFETKGAEYLFIIGYLLLLFVVWKLSGKQTKVKDQIQKALNSLSANILKVPQGLFYYKQHTWAHLEESGLAKVGLDDFLQRIIGKVNFIKLKYPGEIINKGDLLAVVVYKNKKLSVFSPISGEIFNTNVKLLNDPEVFSEDPYQKGWIYKIKPTKWREETSACYFAEEAVRWTHNELNRFKDFLADSSAKRETFEPSMTILQDGGEIQNDVLHELSVEIWSEFQSRFLDPESNPVK